MSFISPDPAAIRTWGVDVLFTPQLSPSTTYLVKMLRDDDMPEFEQLKSPLMVLFGTPDDSGFTAVGAPAPIRNDVVEVNGVEYRVYDVKRDDAGGTEGTSGLWLYLDEKPD